eukprot:CAMPEP_0116057526 /NCGR_PEP_ID=MMETSP0322-20121206/4660_1 /TAXON_ID=163516 /ORGANISM="Leptocylindrus danicus var. apora, Strain B651" /LENGTH=354 /DNA_ID=CAMNT_0003541547 /DNA_START=219 /DNA_END=1283 /DNA_ORIENTATION=-
MAQERRYYNSLEPTTFGPSGRLHAVERVFEEATAELTKFDVHKFLRNRGRKDDEDEENLESVMPGRLTLGIICEDFICVTSIDLLGVRNLYDSTSNDESVSDFYEPLAMSQVQNDFDIRSQSPVFVRLDNSIMATTAGDPIDAQILLKRTEDVGNGLHKMYGTAGSEFLFRLRNVNNSLSTAEIARTLADAAQASTQSVGSKTGRMLVSSALVFGYDCRPRNELRMWRVDPTGQFYSVSASCIGRGAGAVERTLLKRIYQSSEDEKNDTNEDTDYWSELSNDEINTYLRKLSTSEAIDLCCSCLRDVTQILHNSEDLFWKNIQSVIVDRNFSANKMFKTYNGQKLRDLLSSTVS